MSKVIPLGHQILLKSLDAAKDTGGIIIPETVKKTERLDYIVEAIGSQVKESYPSFEVGMRVIIGKFKEQTFRGSDGNDYILTHSDNIEGIIK